MSVRTASSTPASQCVVCAAKIRFSLDDAAVAVIYAASLICRAYATPLTLSLPIFFADAAAAADSGSMLRALYGAR